MQSLILLFMVQVLQDAHGHIQLKLSTVAAVLEDSVQKDIRQSASSVNGMAMSAMTTELLSLWRQCASTEWVQLLDVSLAASVAQLLVMDQRWHEVAHLFGGQAQQSRQVRNLVFVQP